MSPGLKSFVILLSRGLESAGFDLDEEDTKKLAEVMLEIIEMRRLRRAGNLQVNFSPSQGIVSVSPQLQRVGTKELGAKWSLECHLDDLG